MSLASNNCNKIKLYQFQDTLSNERLFQKINTLNPNEVKKIIKIFRLIYFKFFKRSFYRKKVIK
jgi:hypothetical protein